MTAGLPFPMAGDAADADVQVTAACNRSCRTPLRTGGAATCTRVTERKHALLFVTQIFGYGA